MANVVQRRRTPWLGQKLGQTHLAKHGARCGENFVQTFGQASGAPTFTEASADETAALIGYETEILETLAEAQESAVRYIVVVHAPVRRRRGTTTGPAVLRWLLTRAPWTWDYVKRSGVRFFRDATLAGIRLPAPTEADYRQHYDALAARHHAQRTRPTPPPTEDTPC